MPHIKANFQNFKARNYPETLTEDEQEDCIIMIKTVQIAPFRTLMVALKDILLETNFTFQKDGIRIVNMDKSQTILVHMHLQADNFEYFDCKKEKIIVGVNMLHFFKLINSIDNDETLSIYIEHQDYNDGIVEYLNLKFENKNILNIKNEKTIYNIPLKNMNNSHHINHIKINHINK